MWMLWMIHFGLLIGLVHNIMVAWHCGMLIMVGVLSMGKRQKKNKRVLFCSPQCVTVSQDKAHLLERRSLFKVCVYLCGCGCVRVSLCVCWTTELLLSPLLADHSLTLFSIVRRRRDKRAHQRNAAVGFFFSATLRPKGTIRRSRLDFLFPHFTDTKKKKITYLHLHLVFSLILPVPQSFLFWDFSLVSPFFFLRKAVIKKKQQSSYILTTLI